MNNTTVNDAEIAKFTAMAEQWWDPKGKFKPLHKFNPVRMRYIRDHLIRHFDRDPLRALTHSNPSGITSW